MKHITGKGVCWSIYGLAMGILIYIGMWYIAMDVREAVDGAGRERGASLADEAKEEEREIDIAEEKEKEEEVEEVEEEATRVVEIKVIPKATPIPTKRPDREIDDYPRNYKISERDVERIAKLLWSSPLRSESAKRTLVWVVLNRVDDDSGVFGNSIEEVVKKSEFSFYDRKAHISDKNKSIVREVMQAWEAEKDGYYVGRHCPKSGVYIRFEGEGNRSIEVTGTVGGMALEW